MCSDFVGQSDLIGRFLLEAHWIPDGSNVAPETNVALPDRTSGLTFEHSQNALYISDCAQFSSLRSEKAGDKLTMGKSNLYLTIDTVKQYTWC